MIKICFTGHRPNKLPGGYNQCNLFLKNPILEILTDLKDKIEYAHCGMALGFDQATAIGCIKLNIPVVACIPCKNYENKWPQSSKDKYYNIIKNIIKKNGKTIYISEEYTPYCLQQRNVYMVDNSDLVIAGWDGSSGGTANCIKYAESKGKEVINIWSKIVQ
jgi:uncharacterized phage-like protein YoqJ